MATRHSKADQQKGEGREGPVTPGSPLRTVFISLLLDLLAFTVILPLFPAILEYYGKEGKDDLYIWLKKHVDSFGSLVGAPDSPQWNSVLFGGLLGSTFSFLQFLASPILGAASDRYGRRPVLLISMVGVMLSYVLWGLSSHFTMFVVARIIGGLSKGNVSLCTAIVTDVCKPEERGKGMAMIGIAFAVGFLIGPLIGAGFSKAFIGGSVTFFVPSAIFAIVLSSVDVLYLYFALSETLPASKRSLSFLGRLSDVLSLINPVSLFMFSSVQGTKPQEKREMRRIGLTYFVYLFLYSGLEFTLTFLTRLRFDYSSLQQGRMFFFIGVIMILVQGGYVRRIPSSKLKGSCLMALLAIIPGFLLVGLSSSQWALYGGLALYAFASGVVVPNLTTLMSSHGRADQKGTVLGVFRSLGAFARALGPVVASVAYWSVGPEVTYAIGGVLMVVPIAILMSVNTTKISAD